MTDSGQRPKVSVVFGCRNEYPTILGTMHSFMEELEHWGYPFELIVVDNLSTDNTAPILRDKFRRLIRNGLLKVIRYDERPANVTVRNVGARAATGDVLFLSDGHMSVKIGTCHAMIQAWLREGRKGLFHASTNIWGDTTEIRCYGYDLKLELKFWGNLSRYLPPDVKDPETGKLRDYWIPMSSHSCLMAGREEYLDFGGYNEFFRCYGGGEPYLDLKWWLFGSKVWIVPEGLFRHGFGVNAMWRTASRDKHVHSSVYVSDGRMTADLKKGDVYLHYARGYAWNNEQFTFNFMLSAYTIGGYRWLETMYARYHEERKRNSRYLRDLQDLRREVLRDGAADRAEIERRQVCSLDDLLVAKPWDRRPWEAGAVWPPQPLPLDVAAV